MKLEERCKSIEFIVSDVDGVLTDGGVLLDNEGIEAKQYHIRDGLGIKVWRKAGFRFGIITGRNSQTVRLRSSELGIDVVRQGVDDKLTVANDFLKHFGLNPQQLAYIGDDLPDLPVVRIAGLGVAVNDAAAELREAAHFVTTAPGGRGAVRELVELILKAQGRWADIVRSF
ncbi:KdsC family phosphatase [Blastopirellula retiformator]|uniref:3-deoxy-D-manno-octulosonate 8-phosphate phosphatase KdsC n=1 Tax=Blastopirellula retiformator TaxID=2527970 RepID=A0A5C5V3S7_9BACT|nr:HAD hydrolase family protein [Blastopirellula retiformator]TWT33218.1 3-deoxy-D-manno-octulosonate 8-phosphate phosphatase KdsC [Blastopirellula retiformator]